MRLELDSLAMLGVLMLYFNSIKVRLELSANNYVFHAFFYFNSIKVRLEPSGFIAAIAATVFQFHKGAIRTR